MESHTDPAPQREHRDHDSMAHVEQAQKDHETHDRSRIARLDPERIEKGVPADPDPDDPASP